MAHELLRALKTLPPDPQRRIRVALAFLGVTQTRLAFKTGIDPGLLSANMNGNRDWTSAQQEAVAAFLGVPVAVLFEQVAA